MVSERASLYPEVQNLGKPYTATQLLDRIESLRDRGRATR